MQQAGGQQYFYPQRVFPPSNKCGELITGRVNRAIQIFSQPAPITGADWAAHEPFIRNFKLLMQEVGRYANELNPEQKEAIGYLIDKAENFFMQGRFPTGDFTDFRRGSPMW